MKARIFLLSFAFVLMAMGGSGGWVGSWAVTDTQGRPYELTLMADGSASARGSQSMDGYWEEKDGKAYVTWNTGWLAILWEADDGYRKDAFAPGLSFTSAMTDRSVAMRK